MVLNMLYYSYDYATHHNFSENVLLNGKGLWKQITEVSKHAQSMVKGGKAGTQVSKQIVYCTQHMAK